jgi:peptide/nickel transport system ATP-binding protein
MKMALLEVRNLTVTLKTRRGKARAVRDLNFKIDRGATIGIVGESGCGKSMAGLAMMGLLPDGAIATGEVLLDGVNLLNEPESSLRHIRGKRMAMVFQEPMTSLNPVHTVGRQVSEALRIHKKIGARAAVSEATAMLRRVELRDPQRQINSYPHQLSGGERQRVMIAIALACGPDILIADEPTTALDVTIQRQILDLIAGLVEEFDMGLLLISHDLAIIAQRVQRLLVMYGGACVEEGETRAVFAGVAHPYTLGLMAAMPRFDGTLDRLPTILGTVPAIEDLPPGCPFAGRCELTIGACHEITPDWSEIGPDHTARCLRLDAVREREAAS